MRSLSLMMAYSVSRCGSHAAAVQWHCTAGAHDVVCRRFWARFAACLGGVWLLRTRHASESEAVPRNRATNGASRRLPAAMCPTAKHVVDGRRTSFRNALGGSTFFIQDNHVILKKEGRVLASLVKSDNLETVVSLPEVKTETLKRVIEYCEFFSARKSFRDARSLLRRSRGCPANLRGQPGGTPAASASSLASRHSPHQRHTGGAAAWLLWAGSRCASPWVTVC